MGDFVPGRPAADEYAPYYEAYVGKVAGEDPVAALAAQLSSTQGLLHGLDEAGAAHRYAPGKWSVKEVIAHITDTERVFGFRALWFAREDPSPLPGFDENRWMPAAEVDLQPLDLVRAAWHAQREATLALLRGLPRAAWIRRGTANGKVVSVRAIAFIMAGHETHHLGVLRERYGVR